MGSTCIPMADSFWYMAKPIQYCKVKKKKKNLGTISLGCNYQGKYHPIPEFPGMLTLTSVGTGSTSQTISRHRDVRKIFFKNTFAKQVDTLITSKFKINEL